jgi:hypothetical protein
MTVDEIQKSFERLKVEWRRCVTHDVVCLETIEVEELLRALHEEHDGIHTQLWADLSDLQTLMWMDLGRWPAARRSPRWR